MFFQKLPYEFQFSHSSVCLWMDLDDEALEQPGCGYFKVGINRHPTTLFMGQCWQSWEVRAGPLISLQGPKHLASVSLASPGFLDAPWALSPLEGDTNPALNASLPQLLPRPRPRGKRGYLTSLKTSLIMVIPGVGYDLFMKCIPNI